jgi:hypothetical protein
LRVARSLVNRNINRIIGFTDFDTVLSAMPTLPPNDDNHTIDLVRLALSDGSR